MLQKEPYSYTLWEEYLGDALKEGGDVALHAFDKATTTFPTNVFYFFIFISLYLFRHSFILFILF